MKNMQKETSPKPSTTPQGTLPEKFVAVPQPRHPLSLLPPEQGGIPMDHPHRKWVAEHMKKVKEQSKGAGRWMMERYRKLGPYKY
jgi:hypothetical protein